MYAPTAPTGVFLGHLKPGTPEWDAARAGLTITATEIAAVLGLSPWQSAFSLWHKKAGLPSPPFEQTPAMEWGVRLEDAVAAKFADEHTDVIPVASGTWRHRARHWQRATPDRLLYLTKPAVDWTGAADIHPDPVGLLEVKTSPFGEEWGPDGSGEIPVWYRAQALWQMDVLGLTETHFAVLISGHDYREYTVPYDPAEAEFMRHRAESFLYDVANGHRPPIDGSDATYQTVRRLPDGLEDRDVEISPELAERYEATAANLHAAEDARRQAVSEILAALGNARRAVCLDRRIAIRTVRDGHTHALMPTRTRKEQAA